MNKTCVQCGVEQPEEAFDPRSAGAVRLHTKCRDCCSSNAAYQRAWRANNKDKAKDYELRRTHGITLAQYEVLLERQGGNCAVCFRPPGSSGTGGNSVGSLAVDHCHQTGAVRGLLCTNCNLGVGSFFNSPELIERAAAYIREFHKTAVQEDLPELGPRLRRVPEGLRKIGRRGDSGPTISGDDLLDEMLS